MKLIWGRIQYLHLSKKFDRWLALCGLAVELGGAEVELAGGRRGVKLGRDGGGAREADELGWR